MAKQNVSEEVHDVEPLDSVDQDQVDSEDEQLEQSVLHSNMDTEEEVIIDNNYAAKNPKKVKKEQKELEKKHGITSEAQAGTLDGILSQLKTIRDQKSEDVLAYYPAYMQPFIKLGIAFGITNERDLDQKQNKRINDAANSYIVGLHSWDKRINSEKKTLEQARNRVIKNKVELYQLFETYKNDKIEAISNLRETEEKLEKAKETNTPTSQIEELRAEKEDLTSKKLEVLEKQHLVAYKINDYHVTEAAYTNSINMREKLRIKVVAARSLATQLKHKYSTMAPDPALRHIDDQDTIEGFAYYLKKGCQDLQRLVHHGKRRKQATYDYGVIIDGLDPQNFMGTIDDLPERPVIQSDTSAILDKTRNGLANKLNEEIESVMEKNRQYTAN